MIYLLKSEYKFLYIFHDITDIYLKIYSYFMEYIQTTKGRNNKLTSTAIDIIDLLIDSFIIMCDNQEGFYNYSKYDLI
jgi:hypothetical protein